MARILHFNGHEEDKIMVHSIKFPDGRNSFIIGAQYTSLEKWYPNYEHFREHEIEPNTVIASNKLSFDPKYSYDLSEFLLYSLVPLLLFASYRLIKDN